MYAVVALLVLLAAAQTNALACTPASVGDVSPPFTPYVTPPFPHHIQHQDVFLSPNVCGRQRHVGTLAVACGDVPPEVTLHNLNHLHVVGKAAILRITIKCLPTLF